MSNYLLFFLCRWSTPGGNTVSAVEHTCALLLAVSR